MSQFGVVAKQQGATHFDRRHANFKFCLDTVGPGVATIPLPFAIDAEYDPRHALVSPQRWPTARNYAESSIDEFLSYGAFRASILSDSHEVWHVPRRSLT
jgi:hypothetical protein